MYGSSPIGKARSNKLKNFNCKIKMSNGHRDRETPEPIPNSEAKPVYDMKYCSNGWESILLFGILFFPYV